MTKSRRTSDLVNSILVNPDNSVNIHEGTESPYFLLTTGATPTPEQGMLFWDADRQTAGLQMNGVEARLGQDNFWYVKNQSGSDILKGTAVMAVGALGASSRILVAPMVADGSVDAIYLLGITAEDILNGEDGFVMNIGKIRGIDTTQYGTQAGQVLYCDPATPGGFTITQPDAPNLDIPIAFTVDYKSNGTIAVRVNPGYNIGELHDVYSNSPSNNDILLYNSTNSRWENTPLSSAVPTPTLQSVTDAGNTTTNNLLIGTTTDAGYKLDVNGTGRFTSELIVQDIYIGKGGDDEETNTAVGYNALANNTAPYFGAGFRNTAFGYTALFSNTTGSRNTSVGRGAGESNTTGASNVFLGESSGQQNIIGSSNVYIGHGAGGVQDSSGNTYVGTSAGYSAAQGTGNSVYIGLLAGHATTGGDNVFLGNNAGFGSTKSDWLIIGNRNNAGLIEGNFATGNVLIGTSTDSGYKLDVNGTARAVKSKIDFTPTSDTIALDIRGTGTPNDYFTVSNATGGANDVFLPIFFYKAATYGYNGGTNRYTSGVYGGGFVAAVDDTSYPSAIGAGAAMHFNSRTYTNNGPLTNRYLFSWGSWLTTHMAMTAGGNLLINTTTDAGYKLDVNGVTRTQGLLSLGTGTNSTAIGLNAAASGTSAIAIGTNAGTSSQDYSISIGNGTYSDWGAVAIGNTARANFGGVAIGRESGYNNGGSRFVAIGTSAKATAYSVTVGFAANSISSAVAMGHEAYSDSNSVAIGDEVKAYGNSSVVLGRKAQSLGSTAISVGYYCRPRANSIAIGYFAANLSTGEDNIFLGYNVGVSSTVSDWLIIGNRNNPSLIEGNFATGNVMIGTSTDSGYKLDVNGVTRTQGLLSLGTGTDSTAIGLNAISSASSSIAIGTNSESGGDNCVAIGNGSRTIWFNSIAIGLNSAANITAVGIGGGVTALNRSVAVGDTSYANKDSVAIGNIATTNTGEFAVAIGQDAQVFADYGVALGQDTRVNQIEGIAIGADAASSNGGIAIGRFSVASLSNAVAIGRSVTALYADGTTVNNFAIANYALLDFPDDIAAGGAGVPLGGVYHTGGTLKIRIT
jgi:hypothetical protein